jgi:hypothetical protein
MGTAQGGHVLAEFPWRAVLDEIEGMAPMPHRQYEKAFTQVVLGTQNLSCLIDVATGDTLARGVSMGSVDWMAHER